PRAWPAAAAQRGADPNRSGVDRTRAVGRAPDPHIHGRSPAADLHRRHPANAIAQLVGDARAGDCADPNRRSAMTQVLRRPRLAVAVGRALPGAAGAEHFFYRRGVGVRPLRVFGTSGGGGGGAPVTRGRGSEYGRSSLLIGPDPDRAPRRINRWGYIQEEM